MAGDEGLDGAKFLPSGLGRKNINCREICAVAVVAEYRQTAEYAQWALAEGSEFLFPGVQEDREKRNLALAPAQMTTNLPTHVRAAVMEDTRYEVPSFRWGGAASHNMNSTCGHGRSYKCAG